MSKKIYAMLLPVVAVAAFAIAPAAASALKSYGTCATGTTTHPPCPTGQHFTEFTEKREAVKQKTAASEFVLETATGANGFKCKVIDFVGKMWNVGGVGHSHLILVFEECKGFGELAACTTPNGNGIIEGVVTDKVKSEEEVEVTIESGFGIECPSPIGPLGNVTGTAVGKQTKETAQLKFAKATGLSLAGKPSTITGNVEFETLTGKLVFI